MSEDEDVIDLVEFSSPIKLKDKIIKRSNKISSPQSSPSLASARTNDNVVSLFEVRHNTPSSKTRTTSFLPKRAIYEKENYLDLSDDVFTKEEYSSSGTLSQSEGKTYKDRIRQRFNNIKQKAGMTTQNYSTKNARDKQLMKRIRRESSDVDAEILSIRSKLGLNQRPQSKEEKFFFFNFVDDDNLPQIGSNDGDKYKNIEKTETGEDEINIICMSLPEQVRFIAKLSEKEWYFIPKLSPLNVEAKIEENEPRIFSDDGFYIPDFSHVPSRYINLLEQRLLAIDDKIWFNSEGTLDFVESPIINKSIRPFDCKVGKNKLTSLVPSTKGSECNEVIVIREKILNLQLFSLKFTHHPLFSVEHVFQERLKELYEKYRFNLTHHNSQKIKSQLEALRTIRNSISEKSLQVNDTSRKPNPYTKEIQALRELLFQKGKEERDLCKSILETWTAIKKIREKNKYSNTSIKLIIKKEKTNYLIEKEENDKYFEMFLNEICAERELEEKEKLEKVEINIEKFKATTKTDEEDEKDDTETYSQSPSHMIDKIKIRSELERRFEDSFKTPGEPYLFFHLVYDHEITKKADDPKENLRRSVISTTKLFMQILCDKIEVCSPKPLNLNDTFTCHINETFSIQLYTIPKSIIIEIMEQPKHLLKRKICEIKINTPAQGITLEQNKPTVKYFTKNEILHYKHNGVGSGIMIDTFGEKYNLHNIKNETELNTSGFVSYNIGWEYNSEVNVDYDTNGIRYEAINQIIGKNGSVNYDQLSQWMTQNVPDPQDPQNSVFYEYTSEYESKIVTIYEGKKYFRLNPHSRKQFCSTSELENNMRLKILQLRDQNEPEFDGIMVPNRLKEIPFHLLSDYNRRLTNKKTCYLPDEEYENDIDSKRNIGKKNLKQIHIHVFQMCKTAKHNLLYENVVDEKYLTQIDYQPVNQPEEVSSMGDETPQFNASDLTRSNLGNQVSSNNSGRESLLCKLVNLHREDIKKKVKLFENLRENRKIVKHLLISFFNWFRWRPEQRLPTHNMKSIQPKTNHENVMSDDASLSKIIFEIKTGINLPKRTNDVASNEDPSNENEVHAFVEIAYNSTKLRTATAIGSNPTWNEKLIVPLESHNIDYLSPNSLNGPVIINVYDEFRNNTTNSGEKFVNLIGSLQLPMSTICHANSMEGKFKIRLPSLLIGYETEFENRNTKSPSANVRNASAGTYLDMCVTVEPHIPKLTPSMEELPCSDLPYLQEYILKWNEAFNTNFPSRKFSVLTITSGGKTVCVTRYIKPLEPPQLGAEVFEITAEQCARYVSLIPFMECNQFYQNIWLTTEELLNFMLGSIIDHAIALTCYFLALKLDAWLLLGFGIPHGSTAYVLTRESSNEPVAYLYYIYDVTSGEKLNITEVECPVQRVYCLINEENVWANTQRNVNVNFMRWDLSRKSDWLPLFDKSITCPTHSVNSKITYKDMEPVGLEIVLEQKIKKRISKLRPKNRTTWNLSMYNSLKNVLRSFEVNAMYNKDVAETIKEFNDIVRNYIVMGQVINKPYTNVKDILKIVSSVGIHLQDNPKLEFLTSVYVHSYRSQVFSVWILLACILERELV